MSRIRSNLQIISMSKAENAGSRTTAGNPRSSGVEVSWSRPSPWSWRLTPHRVDHQRHFRGQTGLALSRFASIGRSRLLKSFWGTSENNRRAKYYRLSKGGRRQLELETQDWKRISIAIGSALEAM